MLYALSIPAAIFVIVGFYSDIVFVSPAVTDGCYAFAFLYVLVAQCVRFADLLSSGSRR